MQITGQDQGFVFRASAPQSRAVGVPVVAAQMIRALSVYVSARHYPVGHCAVRIWSNRRATAGSSVYQVEDPSVHVRDKSVIFS